MDGVSRRHAVTGQPNHERFSRDEPDLGLEYEVCVGDPDYEDQPYMKIVCRMEMAPMVMDRLERVATTKHDVDTCAEALRAREQCVWWEIMQETENAVCVYEGSSCSTRQVCQRVSDIGFGCPNAWWDRYEQSWQAKPVEEQTRWLNYWNSWLLEVVSPNGTVIELNIDLTEAHMRGFMVGGDVLLRNRAEVSEVAAAKTAMTAPTSPVVNEMVEPYAALSTEGPLPADNIRWVSLAGGRCDALCVAWDRGAPSKLTWQCAAYELRRVVRVCQLQDCNAFDNEGGMQRRDVVQRAFTGTSHEKESVAEAWTQIRGEGGKIVWAFGLGWNKEKRTRAAKAALAVHVWLQTGCTERRLDALVPLARQSASCYKASG